MIGAAALPVIGVLLLAVGLRGPDHGASHPAVRGVAASCILYSAGGIIHARKRPDPAPMVFGYHELFHLLVIIAAALQYAVVAFWVV